MYAVTNNAIDGTHNPWSDGAIDWFNDCALLSSYEVASKGFGTYNTTYPFTYTEVGTMINIYTQIV